MPKAPSRTICWDSCTFVSYIEGTRDRIRDLRAVFEEAINKEIRLAASAVCITEVAFVAAERSGGPSPQVEREIDKLWMPGSPIQIIDYSQLIASKAQKLLRHKLANDLHLKPLDAIHIATAMQIKATALHTFDERLWDWSSTAGVAVQRPKPIQTLLEPDD